LIANERAMQLAGIDAATPDPEGGRIVRWPDGKPTGVFEENAMDLMTHPWEVWQKERPEEELHEEWADALRYAEDICLAYGITSFQDAGTLRPRLDFIRKWVEADHSRIRMWMMLRTSLSQWETHSESLPWKNLGEDRLTVRSVKVYADGALGSYGAWLLQSYTDRPDLEGQIVTPMDTLKAFGELAIRRNIQVCVHAIGDRGVREVLDVFEHVMEENPTKDNLRWRIEHAQHIDTADIPRFASLGVVASMQPIHCISDAPFVEKRLGPDRARMGAYVWRSLLDYGTRFAIGTDTPIEPVDPFLNIYAAITRKRLDTQAPFYPEQAMTRKEALHSYTLGNAWAAFEEKQKGSLSPGKWADLIILSQNILTCPEEAIPHTRVRRTMIAGEEVYTHPGLPPLVK
jgi:predicted amidohydrolase YtcJ